MVRLFSRTTPAGTGLNTGKYPGNDPDKVFNEGPQRTLAFHQDRARRSQPQ